jgi:glycosyltransferase involved in cell wall biosynthesis
MRILIATTHRGLVGGTETYLRELIPALRARGHDVALVYNVPAAPGQGTVDGDCLDVPAWPFADGAGVEVAARWRPDVCYLQGMLDPEAEERLAGRFRTVLFVHGYYATCASGTKCHRRPAVEPCMRRFSSACLALNYVRGCGVRHPLRLLQNYRYQRRRERLLSRVAAVAVASRHMAAELRRQGAPAERVILAPLFPTSGAPQVAPPLCRPLTGRILMAGRFTNLKGGDLLIEASRKASARLGRRLTLLFAGEGPEAGPWKAQARRLGVDAQFFGWCGAEALARLRADADLLAVPSVWPEPFGLVGIEAGCVGLPAIGFAVGGIPDWLLPGISGESAPPPATAEGLAGALVRALATPEHHHRLRLGAWETSRQFTPERHLVVLEGLLLGCEPLPLAHWRA